MLKHDVGDINPFRNELESICRKISRTEWYSLTAFSEHTKD